MKYSQWHLAFAFAFVIKSEIESRWLFSRLFSSWKQTKASAIQLRLALRIHDIRLIGTWELWSYARGAAKYQNLVWAVVRGCFSLQTVLAAHFTAAVKFEFYFTGILNCTVAVCTVSSALSSSLLVKSPPFPSHSSEVDDEYITV